MSELIEDIETLKEKKSIARWELLRDYIEIIDNQTAEILSLKRAKDKMLQELREIEQILGKALHFPWFKDDPMNFPSATEKDGVVVAGPTWELAKHAADKIKRLEDDIEVLENELA